MEENKNSKLKWFLGHFEEVSCAVLFSVMTLIASANIVTRYMFRYSFAFTEELVVSLFVWLTLFGASIAFEYRVSFGIHTALSENAHSIEANSDLVFLCLERNPFCRFDLLLYKASSL